MHSLFGALRDPSLNHKQSNAQSDRAMSEDVSSNAKKKYGNADG
jgi:hypothetical protein